MHFFHENVLIMSEHSNSDFSQQNLIFLTLIKPYIESYGTDEQVKRYMSDMREGKIIGAIAMTEPSAGSDLQGNFCNKNFENHNIFFYFL